MQAHRGFESHRFRHNKGIKPVSSINQHWLTAIRLHEQRVMLLSKCGRLKDAAIEDSPSNIGRAYINCLIDLERNGYAQDNEKRRQATAHISAWMAQATPSHIIFANSVKNLDELTHEHAKIIAQIILQSLTFQDVITMVAKKVGLELISNRIPTAAKYYASVQKLKHEIEVFIAIEIIGRR
ncbi:hypothetical protein [Sphingobium sp. MK2]|uniref:hypothetical protein n=1 Tax=Sphingobium sp. MK2 TaxID=3116540 RepID=UPI0032E366CA